MMADVTSPFYVFLPKMKHAGKCVEKLTQAKYESNARGEGSDLAPLTPPLVSLRIQNSFKIQGFEKKFFFAIWLTARTVFKISQRMIEGWMIKM